MNYTNCSFNFFFKHFSLVSVVFVYYIFISQGYILGVKVLTKGKNNKYIEDSTSLGFEAHGNEIKIVINDGTDDFEKSESKDNGNIENSESIISDRKKSILVENFVGSVSFSKLNKDSIDCFKDIIRKSENCVYSELLEALFVYLLYLISIITLILFFKFKDDYDKNFVQNDTGEWYYRCELENVNFLLMIMNLILLITVFIRRKKAMRYECIFVCLKFIFYSFYVLITLGPAANVIY